MKLFEIKSSGKAGFIPYIIDGDQILFMFMVSSDPAFGGPDPSIAKGGIDPGETAKEAGIREAQEELGLVVDNLKQDTVALGWQGKLTGLKETYSFSVYAGEVKNKKKFVKPHYETGAVHWMTEDEFNRKGRQSQRHIVAAVASTVRKNHRM